MNGKKLLMYAILFGFISATSLYFFIKPAEPEVVMAKDTQIASTKEPVKKSPANELLKIDNGKRGVSISVNDSQGVSGFITPGSLVDVISISEANEKGELLLKGIKVLAVGRITTKVENAQNNVYQTVTVEVTPEEGASLIYAANKGFISLMLVGTKDTDNK